MDSLNDRRDAFENKFAHDETLRFRAIARRNRLLGAWAAYHLGHEGEVAEAYAESIVQAGVVDPVRAVSRVSDDLSARGIEGRVVLAKAEELLAAASEEVRNG